MKRTILGMLPAWLAMVTLLASDAVVEKVVTFTNDSKTSVVINYSGSDSLRFFALDSAEGVFTLDLPGTFSKFDFSTLDFPQVLKVMQVPLDPDSTSGISVRFFLARNVDYNVFEAGAGELVLFFEANPAIVEDAVVQSDVVDAKPEFDESSNGMMADASAQAILDGKPGEQRLSRLSVVDGPDGGRIFLRVQDASHHKTFFLSNPKRFVLDLHETILSLDQGDLSLDSPLVQGIRVRQFQSHPTAICRIVLDLKDETNVNVQPTDYGFLVAYAANTSSLDQLMSATAEPMAQVEPEVTVAASEAAPSNETTTVADSQPVFQESADTVDQQLDAFAADDITEETVVQNDFSSEPMTETADESTNVDDAIASSETAENLSSEADSSNSSANNFSSSDRLAEEEDIVEPVVVTDNVTPTAEPEETLVQDASSLSSDESVYEPVTSFDSQPMDETILEEASAPDQTMARSSERLAGMNVTNQADTTVETSVDDDIMPRPLPATDESLIRPLPESQIQAAGDVDREMEQFLELDDDQSLYQMMRDVKSNHANIGTVVVTNQTLADNQNALTESSSMQGEVLDAEPADIFRAQELKEERLDEGDQEYRGFEIAVIDVKDANVVDLLRFIADRVGINLYVDSSVGDIKATYRFTQIPWDQALDIILTNANLDKQFTNGVLRVATTEKFRQEEQARADLRLQRELSVDTERVLIPLNYADAAEVLPIVQEQLSPRGMIVMDERTNTLIIEEIPKRMVSIRALVRRLDTIIPQVTIEARMVETNKRFLRELGIQWGLNADFSPELGTDTGLAFPNRVGVGGPIIGLPEGVGTGPRGGYAINFPTTGENPSGIGLTLGNFLDNFKLDISLQMLETEGYGQIISSPKITTQNNKTALIKNGQRVPIQTIQRGVVTIRYIDAVLELQVTPHITSDETIIMDIVVDKSEPDFTRTVAGNPVINIRRAETKVLVKNGGTAVIGGIFTLNETSNSSGIPTLRKVPILKRLFSSELDSMENQELLIFVTPQIVKY